MCWQGMGEATLCVFCLINSMNKLRLFPHTKKMRQNTFSFSFDANQLNQNYLEHPRASNE